MKVPDTGTSLRLITHNIRYAATAPATGERPWSERCPRLVSQLQFQARFAHSAFICLQEVLHEQLEDIISGLNAEGTQEWAYLGVGRDDGKQAGEYAPIFYRPAVWQLEHSKTFWLSQTPDRPSKGWDAASIRIVTLGVFVHVDTRQRLVVMNTHLDDQGSTARQKAAKLILEEANSWTGYQRWPSSLPVLLAGDMNSTETQEAYRILNSLESPLKDIRKSCTLPYGFNDTFTGFDGQGDGEGLKRIDFIFCGHKKGGWWAVEGYAVLDNFFDDKVYLSDHRAVVGDLVLR